jgi:CARDB
VRRTFRQLLALAVVAVAAAVVPLAHANPPAGGLSANVTATVDDSSCSHYRVHGTVTWSGAKVDTIVTEVGENTGGTVGTDYAGPVTDPLSPAKRRGSVDYFFSGYSIPSTEIDLAVMVKFFLGTTEYSTAAFIDVGHCTGLPDLVITDMTSNGTGGWDVTVANQGVAPATLDQTVTIQAYYSTSSDTTQWPPLGGSSATPGGDPACGTSFAPTYNTTLEPGTSTTIPMSCSPPNDSSDTYLLARVDDANVITESNEKNNVFSITIT